MSRLLLLVLIGVLIWFAARLVSQRRERPDEQRPEVRPQAGPPEAALPVQQCAWCGVHVPTGRAVALPDGRTYCGPAHRDAAAAAADRDPDRRA